MADAKGIEAAWKEAQRRAVADSPRTRLDDDWALAVADLERRGDPSSIKTMLASAEFTQHARDLLVDLFDRRALGKKIRGRKHALYTRDKFWERTVAHYVAVRSEQLSAQIKAAREKGQKERARDLVEKEATVLEDVAREFGVKASTLRSISKSKDTNYNRDRRKKRPPTNPP